MAAVQLELGAASEKMYKETGIGLKWIEVVLSDKRFLR